MPRRKKPPIRIGPIAKYLSQIGKKGGKAGTGKAKARTKAQARKAALKRWHRRSSKSG